MKLKSLLVLTAALSFGVAAAQTDTTAPATTAPAAQAPTLTDVPAGHWATDAINKLVARGIILGYPDGTFRGTQNLTRYEAAVIIARLLDQMAAGQVPSGSMDSATLTSLQNAVQELSADLAALGVRVSDLEDNAVSKDDFARLEDRVTNLEGANGDAQAVGDLRSQLDDLSSRVDDLSSNYDQLRADVDDNSSSISALNDLTVLLNQDILDLQDRVSALEAGQINRADFDNLVGRVNDIDTRVQTLEKAPVVSLTGAFTSTNGSIALTSGTQNFDIDRLTTGTFLGSALSDGDVTSNDTVLNDNFSTGLSASFGLGVKNLSTANGVVVINNANLGFSVNNVFTDPAETTDTTVYLTSAALNGTIAQQPFSVLYNYDYSNFHFNEYVFDNDAETDYFRRGVVAKFKATAIPLSPDIQLVVGNGTLSENTLGSTTTGGTTTTNVNARPYFGVRAAINPFGLGTLGLAYATGTSGSGAIVDNDTPANDVASTFAVRDILSADFNFTVGPVALDGVYADSIVRPNSFGNGNTAFYTRAKAAFGFINAVANYRAIDPAYANGDAGLSQDGLLTTGNNNAPFNADQRGFGVGAQGTLSIATIGAYYDSRSTYSNAFTSTNFGVNAGAANIFSGFGLKGFYNSSTGSDGNTYDQSPFTPGVDGSDAYAASTSAGAMYQGTVPAPYRFTSSYGAVLTHDGTQTNALIPNLNLTFGYAHFYNSGSNDFQAYGDYTANFGSVTVHPFARYHSNSGGTARIYNAVTALQPGAGAPGNADGTTTAASYSTFKVGTQLTTAPLTGIFFSPSLDSGIAYRSTTFGGSDTFGSPTTELYGKIGVKFNSFFADGVTFGVGYSFYSASNLGNNGNGDPGIAYGDNFDAFSASRDRVFTRKPSTTPFQTARTASALDTGTVNGVYAQLNVYGVTASYGVFQLNSNLLGSSTGQGFKVGYNVNF